MPSSTSCSAPELVLVPHRDPARNRVASSLRSWHRIAFGLLGIALAARTDSVEAQKKQDAELPARRVVVEIDSPERALFQIAVPKLLTKGTKASLGDESAKVLRRDFELISLFKVLPTSSYIANAEAEGLSIRPDAWQSVGAQGVIKGQIAGSGRRLSLELRFYELAKGARPSLQRRYSGTEEQLRNLMHRFASEVIKVLTGTPGPFPSRIAFARRLGKGRKDVFTADFDGYGVQRISNGRGVSLLPAFYGKSVWYSRLGKRDMIITRTGLKERPVISSRGMDMAPTFCNGRVYFTSTRDGNAEIYSASLNGSNVRRLTNHRGIDISPACGPRGEIAFVSSRHGGPQIFVMDGNGGNIKRVTFRGAYNQTPAWCPDPKRRVIAFTGRSKGLDVFTVDLDTQEYVRITQGQGSNKDPAFSPDCRILAFASSRGGIVFSRPDGLNQQMVMKGVFETLRWAK